MSRNQGGQSDSRWNALWGKGTRGGDSRSNALWGKGGRGVVVTSLAAFMLVLPVGALAGGKPANPKSGKSDIDTYVAPGLLEQAAANPETTLKLIVQSSGGVDGAEKEFNNISSEGPAEDRGKLKRRLTSIGAVAIELKAKHVAKLAEKAGLVITPDARVRPLGLTSDQLWTSASTVNELWGKDAVTCALDALGGLLDPLCVASAAVVAPHAPAIAVVDSGIEPRHDFGARLVASVTFTTSTANSAGDGRGHGTMVAGLAAGSGPAYAGAAPNANLVSIDVLDDNGAGLTSDVIAGADWILANKDAYNIRVANFSVGAGGLASFRFSPLNKAVQRLWLAGVVVVTSAGNYAVDGAVSGVKYAPGNDPFVITVGAADLAGTSSVADDTAAPFSSWGFTADGFSKPDVSAPGRYMVAPVPVAASLPLAFPERVVAPGYMRMSGTSFSTAVVSGIAAQILARHPEFTPDQVKGALMLKARPLGLVATRAAGVGEVDAAASAAVAAPPNPNAALNQFVVSDSSGARVFDHVAWYGVASTNLAWDASSWSESGWAESSWNESSWAESTWNESSWAESTWSESSWAESTWAESTWAESGWAESAWAEGANE